jgi:TolA-binding protein
MVDDNIIKITQFEGALGRIEDKIDNLEKNLIERMKRQEERIEELEESNKWFQRIVIGAVIVSILSLVLINS